MRIIYRKKGFDRNLTSRFPTYKAIKNFLERNQDIVEINGKSREDYLSQFSDSNPAKYNVIVTQVNTITKQFSVSQKYGLTKNELNEWYKKLFQSNFKLRGASTGRTNYATVGTPAFYTETGIIENTSIIATWTQYEVK